jgi:hypothetical protein
MKQVDDVSSLIVALCIGCSPSAALQEPAEGASGEVPVVEVGTSAVVARVVEPAGEMTVAELLEQASIEDTPDNRAVLAVCERYRRAVEAKDVDLLLGLASPSYFDDGGTTGPSDDVDYAALAATLRGALRASSKVNYVFRYRSITWSGDVVRVDYRYSASFRHRDRVQQLSDTNRLELIRNGASFQLLSGM